MTKPAFETPNLTQSNIERIGELFPSVINVMIGLKYIPSQITKKCRGVGVKQNL
jgi:hypothetical protein